MAMVRISLYTVCSGLLDGFKMSEIKMTKEQAEKELVKVAVAWKVLQTGTITTMPKENYEKFLKWLD